MDYFSPHSKSINKVWPSERALVLHNSTVGDSWKWNVDCLKYHVEGVCRSVPLAFQCVLVAKGGKVFDVGTSNDVRYEAY